MRPSKHVLAQPALCTGHPDLLRSMLSTHAAVTSALGMYANP